MILDEIADFIFQYAKTGQDELYRGYQSRMALPGTQRYAVISVLDTARKGTNVNQYAEGLYRVETLREYTVSVDFCDLDQEAAQQKAAVIESIGFDHIAVNFFKERGYCFLYADDVEYLPFVSQQDQYVHRYRVNLHLTIWETTDIEQEHAENVKFDRVENIDVHHKPEEE